MPVVGEFNLETARLAFAMLMQTRRYHAIRSIIGEGLALSMILRKWTAIIRSKDVAEYTRYVETTGGGDYQAVDGNLGHQIVVRDLKDGTSEFSTLSWWTSMKAIEAFAGEHPDRARYYPRDDQYLLSRPETVDHFDVVSGNFPPG